MGPIPILLDEFRRAIPEAATPASFQEFIAVPLKQLAFVRQEWMLAEHLDPHLYGTNDLPRSMCRATFDPMTLLLTVELALDRVVDLPVDVWRDLLVTHIVRTVATWMQTNAPLEPRNLYIHLPPETQPLVPDIAIALACRVTLLPDGVRLQPYRLHGALRTHLPGPVDSDSEADAQTWIWVDVRGVIQAPRDWTRWLLAWGTIQPSPSTLLITHLSGRGKAAHARALLDLLSAMHSNVPAHFTPPHTLPSPTLQRVLADLHFQPQWSAVNYLDLNPTFRNHLLERVEQIPWLDAATQPIPADEIQFRNHLLIHDVWPPFQATARHAAIAIPNSDRQALTWIKPPTT